MHKDFLDRKIQVGDQVVYYYSNSREKILQLAEVLEIRPHGIYCHVIKTNPPNRREYLNSTIRRTDKVTILRALGK